MRRTSRSRDASESGTPAAPIRRAAVRGAQSPDGSFQFNRSQLEGPLGAVLVDGPHALHFRATDASRNTSAVVVDFVLDTAVPAPTLGFSAGSQSAGTGGQTTGAARVTLIGQTESNAIVTLEGTGKTSLATSTGRFQFPDVGLNVGENVFSVKAEDVAGNTATSQATIHRSEQPSCASSQALGLAVVLSPVLRASLLKTNRIGSVLEIDA